MINDKGKKFICGTLAFLTMTLSSVCAVIPAYSETYDEDEEVFSEEETVFGDEEPEDITPDEDVFPEEIPNEDITAAEDNDDITAADDETVGEDGEDGEEQTDTEESTTDVEESSVAELDKLAYTGNDLGVTYTQEASTFKVWSPTATKVQVLLYAKGSAEEDSSKYMSVHEMTYDPTNGVWSATVEGDLVNKYYT